jgi:hypothetical protein
MHACKLYALAAASLLIVPGICSLAQDTSTPQATTPAAPPPQPAPVTAEQAKQLQQSAESLSKAATDTASAADAMTTAATKAATTLSTAADTAEGAAKHANDAATKADETREKLAAQTKATLDALAKKPVQSSHAANPPMGDYVPCLFDGDQDYELRERAHKDNNATLASGSVDGILEVIPVLLKPPALPADATDAQNKANDAAVKSVGDFTKHLKAVESILPTLTSEQLSSLVQQLGAADGLTTDQLKQSNAYLQAVNPPPTYNRPNDVSCSFSVLQWKETKDVFGRRVANNYVALEVNLRNLNKQNEFLVHDIQIAVDTGLTPYEFGRFEATRDKQIVRGVVQRGQSEDRRNLIINSLTAAGAILSPIGSFAANASGSLITGISIFQGPFLVGANNIFPDHTPEYLDNLNDLGFSPSSTNKTVVPVQGSVPLVTFLAEKPLEQLPFVRCGYTGNRDTPNNPLAPVKLLNSKNEVNCQLQPKYTLEADDVNFDDTLTGDFQNPLHFKDWSSAAQNIFGHRVFVVIGGVHIQELSSAPSVSSLNCPPSKTDPKSVDTSKDPVTCTLSGSNLDQVSSSIKLTQGTTTIAGTLTAYASGNTGTISFKLSDVNPAKANGSYELFLTPTAGGTDIDTKQALTFTPPCAAVPSAPAIPTPTATSPTAINLTWPAVTPPANCTVISYNVYGSTTSGFVPGAGNLLTNVSAMSYTNTGLTPGKTYNYVIEAVDEYGTSPASPQASKGTPAK